MRYSTQMTAFDLTVFTVSSRWLTFASRSSFDVAPVLTFFCVSRGLAFAVCRSLYVCAPELSDVVFEKIGIETDHSKALKESERAKALRDKEAKERTTVELALGDRYDIRDKVRSGFVKVNRGRDDVFTSVLLSQKV